jgi:hypothetical protein
MPVLRLSFLQKGENNIILRAIFQYFLAKEGVIMSSEVARKFEGIIQERDRNATLEKLESSDECGARVIARIIRQADAEKSETTMWAQNWNAHSRSS